MGYKEDVQIDKDRLDWEWERHSMLFMEWAERLVEAQDQRDKAKDRVDLCRAELYKSIVSDPTKYGLEKTTENSIQSAIIADNGFLKATEEYQGALKESRILDLAIQAFEHKKKALEKMTDLWIQGYYSSPKIKEAAREKIAEGRSEQHRGALESSPRMRGLKGK